MVVVIFGQLPYGEKRDQEEASREVEHDHAPASVGPLHRNREDHHRDKYQDHDDIHCLAISDVLEVLHLSVGLLDHVQEIVWVGVFLDDLLIGIEMALHEALVRPHEVDLVWVVDDPGEDLVEELFLGEVESHPVLFVRGVSVLGHLVIVVAKEVYIELR